MNAVAEPNLKFNVLRRVFPLVVNSERRIGSSDTISPSTSHVVVEDNIVNISTPKGIRRRSDRSDANVDIEEGPPVAFGPERQVCNSTPRRYAHSDISEITFQQGFIFNDLFYSVEQVCGKKTGQLKKYSTFDEVSMRHKRQNINL
ncbi:PREDICTED: uncharacterized protein LOC105564454 isoform X2 [Vollenhovia emeryi]|uniref:uncharacterized protein LOC105564454 isoform X2 n=1 Tax=Vollenhovia emeryi TaxID=411798 RepID=UPI0005F40D4E|nr:PREDICTED: uncharacterized protein LOC105564454 isoform X2 [Vollenhovia emeryi]